MDNTPFRIPGYADIPPKLFDSDTSSPIRECKICGKELLASNSDYLIQKTFRRFPDHDLDEVIFEFAICNECNQRIHNEISEESKKTIERYFEEQMNSFESMAGPASFNDEETSFDDIISRCAITGKSIHEVKEYTIIAQGRGPRLVLGMLPLAVSFEAQEGLNELLSKKTRDFFDDFTKEHFSGPPGIEELIGPRRPFFV